MKSTVQPIFYTPNHKARAVLLWTVVVFLVGNLVIGKLVQLRRPDLLDPEVGCRLVGLQRCQAEAPDKPLMLVLGSSRPANAICPEAVQSWHGPQPSAPILYNSSMLGMGPVRELMVYRLLRAHGVQPKWLILEAWAPFFPQIAFYREDPNSRPAHLDWSNVPVVTHFYRQRWKTVEQVALSTLAPLLTQHGELVRHYGGRLVFADKNADECFAEVAWRTLDDRGWLPLPQNRPAPQVQQQLIEQGQRTLEEPFARFTISSITDGAYRMLLEECRRDGVQVAFLLLPEHSALRSAYPPAVKAQLASYLQQLGKEYQVPVVDARDWSQDDEFLDMCHLLSEPARRFSARFGRDVYQPLVDGRPLDPSVLLHE